LAAAASWTSSTAARRVLRPGDENSHCRFGKALAGQDCLRRFLRKGLDHDSGTPTRRASAQARKSHKSLFKPCFPVGLVCNPSKHSANSRSSAPKQCNTDLCFLFILNCFLYVNVTRFAYNSNFFHKFFITYCQAYLCLQEWRPMWSPLARQVGDCRFDRADLIVTWGHQADAQARVSVTP
jgi:hypothetical protein